MATVTVTYFSPADTDDLLLPAGSVEYFACNNGDEVAVIDAS